MLSPVEQLLRQNGLLILIKCRTIPPKNSFSVVVSLTEGPAQCTLRKQPVITAL